ncbi:low affinity immunoglobulin gamma Fc region receptor II-like [Poeciliopsis prolifica]|uniref:low affinity immunoglobulin gamma Fc region receptor II-like n=1 Tax=Poeciliopsis prolifica TaxID=188132 RepID=UPI002414260B|nr:low affinity immunoglobulin gamma Fc region receptor II-like [Poeciliopsis prolifica]
MTGSSCTLISPYYHRAVYWCESGSGQFSNAVDITLNCTSNLNDSVRPSDEPVNGANDDQHVTYSLLEFKNSRNKNSHPVASLTVSPDREQLFTIDEIQLNCKGNSADWRVKRLTDSSAQSDLSDCAIWGTMTGSSCTFISPQYRRAVYWCESGSGQFSNAVNITVINEDLLLMSPVHPVTEGASVTLSCRRRGENKLSNVIFYHDDKLIQNDSRGELNISAVSQSDEGFYKCKHSGKVSRQSWMAVKATKPVLTPGSSSFPVLFVVGSVIGVVLFILLLLLCRFRQTKGDNLK